MENKNKIVIVVLIIIVIALLVGVFVLMPNHAKKDTNLTFKSKSTLYEGDSLKFKLTDENGTALKNQTVNITVKDKDNSKSYYSAETNGKGIGTLKLDKHAGKYTVTINYSGNDNYSASNATKNITIKEEKAVESESTPSTVDSSSSSSSSSNDDNYYNGYSKSSFSEGQQAAIDEARANGYSSPAAYHEATGKTAGQWYLDAHPEEASRA